MSLQYVMIGSGIASLSAAEALRQCKPGAAITIVSEEAHDFYSRPGLAYLLRGDIPEKQLTIRTREDLQALKVTRIYARVEELLCESQELVLSDKKRLHYDRLLLATGALAVPPTFPGSDLKGIVKLDGLDDARQILKLARRGKPAVVVGGGITALELAEGLCARGMKVHYFLRGDRYWADVLDEAEAHIVMERLRHEEIVLHLKTQVKQAIGKAGQLTAVETEAGEKVPCEVLAEAIGVKPRVDLARKAGLTVDKGIMVTPRMQTTQPRVFAAGDCAQVGSMPLDVLWPTAITQGRVAGANMAGAEIPYVKGVACNVTMLSGLKVAIIGAVGRGKGAENMDKEIATLDRQLQEKGIGEAPAHAWFIVLGRPWIRWRQNRALCRVLQNLNAKDRANAAPLENLLAQRQRLQMEIDSLDVTRRLLALWHLFHIPLSAGLFTVASIHIVGALDYATFMR